MERFIHPIYTFVKSRSTSIFFIFLLNSYFAEQKDFIFAELGRHNISKINLALLAAARSAVAVAVSYCIYLTFKEQPYRPPSSYSYSNMDFFIDFIAMVTSFSSPLVVMKSTLILLLFASALVLLLYFSLWIYNLFHKNPEESDTREQKKLSPTRRTRSGMIFGQLNVYENELLRLRDQSVERRLPSVARRSSAKRSVK